LTQIIVTAHTLRHLIECERRIWLNQFGELSLRVEPAPPVFVRGIEHEQAISAAMIGPVKTVAAGSWPAMVEATHDLMRRGASGIQGAAFEYTLPLSHNVSITARGRVDWLRRVSQPSAFGGWAYEPVEIKQHNDPNAADYLQLDLYLWLLQQAQDTETSGWFWLGRGFDGEPLNVIEHIYGQQRLEAAFAHVERILTEPSSPPIFLASHCELCPWFAACEQTAVSESAITLLPGLTREMWTGLQQAHIHKLDDMLAHSVDDLRSVKGIGKVKAAEFLAYAAALKTGLPVLLNPLPHVVQQCGIMFDLETRMDDGVPWCFGWQVGDGPFQVAIVDAYCEMPRLKLRGGVEVNFVPDSDTGWQIFADAISAVPGPIYHWSGFELTVLRKTAPRDVIEALDQRLHDLHRTFKRSCVLPMRGTSIKKVAAYLNFQWPVGSDAISAWVDYQRWLRDSDADALAQACAYNRADVQALAVVRRWLVSVADSSAAG
jgi:predicted RecB family nuclease